MKKLARLVSLLLAGVMVMALLAGCNGSFESNSKAEDAILKYIQENYEEKLCGRELTNDAVLRQKAVQLLTKVTDDGRISEKDYVNGTVTYYDSLCKEEITIACAVWEEGPSDDGYLQMKEFTGDASIISNPNLEHCDMILSFGVATRVINGKTYVAIAYSTVSDGE